jgi:hypothetical protein
MTIAILSIAEFRIEVDVSPAVEASISRYHRLHGDSGLKEIGRAIGEHALGSFTRARPHWRDPYIPYPGLVILGDLTIPVNDNWFAFLLHHRRTVSLDKVLQEALRNALAGVAPSNTESSYLYPPIPFPWKAPTPAAATPYQIELINLMIEAGLPEPPETEVILEKEASDYITINMPEFVKIGISHYQLRELFRPHSDHLIRWLQRNHFVDGLQQPILRGLEFVQITHSGSPSDPYPFRWKWAFVKFLRAQPDFRRGARQLPLTIRRASRLCASASGKVGSV